MTIVRDCRVRLKSFIYLILITQRQKPLSQLGTILHSFHLECFEIRKRQVQNIGIVLSMAKLGTYKFFHKPLQLVFAHKLDVSYELLPLSIHNALRNYRRMGHFKCVEHQKCKQASNCCRHSEINLQLYSLISSQLLNIISYADILTGLLLNLCSVKVAAIENITLTATTIVDAHIPVKVFGNLAT